jgi:hypothetical protein
MRHRAYTLGDEQMVTSTLTLGSPSTGDVANAALTIAQLALFAAAGAALGGVIATQQSAPKPYARNAIIGAVALPVIAVVF